MTKENFLKDLEKIYNFLNERKEKENKLIEYFEKKKYNKLKIINTFMETLNLKANDDLILALITRLINLRDDSLIQVLKKLGKKENEIIVYQEKAYDFTKNYWLENHRKLIDFIEDNNLLTPFYREIFKGVYLVGTELSYWQNTWTKHIINTINKDLLKKFDNDENKVFDFLEKENLFDLGHNKQIADRSYSALVEENGKYSSKAYIDAFKKETTKVVDALEEFINRLIELEDEIYNQKWDYVLYLQSLVKAFSENRVNLLVGAWADVDKAWMKIKTPIQIGHPLEYYEDHFRKAVALEWDIRLTNPKFTQNEHRVNKIKSSFEKIFNSIPSNESYKKIYGFSLKSLDKVQLYIGRPALFFAAEFQGLFSAQVVPNDEIVSKTEGKKIFAFSDEILQTSKGKPFLKLSSEFFSNDFLKKDRNFLFKKTQDWHKIYDISTIGHEYGHILWCDDETESAMNKTGNFKNIEEFKATTGGLISFFLDENKDEDYLSEELLINTIKRAVGLIAWMEVPEVQPYYCEGLIHLKALFDCKILNWENNVLTTTLNKENFEELKKWYITTYTNLAKHYLEKKDATLFLNNFAKKENRIFLPIDKNIKDFVNYYYKRYQEIGQELDTNDKKENYIK